VKNVSVGRLKVVCSNWRRLTAGNLTDSSDTERLLYMICQSQQFEKCAVQFQNCAYAICKFVT